MNNNSCITRTIVQFQAKKTEKGHEKQYVTKYYKG